MPGGLRARVTCAKDQLHGRSAGRQGLRDGLVSGRCGPEARLLLLLLLLLLWTCSEIDTVGTWIEGFVFRQTFFGYRSTYLTDGHKSQVTVARVLNQVGVAPWQPPLQMDSTIMGEDLLHFALCLMSTVCDRTGGHHPAKHRQSRHRQSGHATG